MTYDEVLKYCGDTAYKIAKMFEISMATPYHWKKQGFIPIAAQMHIEQKTNGALKADLKHCGRSNAE